MSQTQTRKSTVKQSIFVSEWNEAWRYALCPTFADEKRKKDLPIAYGKE